MMIGYLLCGMAAFYSTYAAYEERAVLPRPNSEEALFTLETIHRANALSAFERLSMVLLTAMEMTLIVMYTFLATTAEQMLIRMAIAVLTTLLCEELATLLLKKREKKNKNEPISLLLMGMFLWLYGLWIFSRMLRHHTTDISITYFCLALCSVGCAVCKVCLSKMESPMGAVAKFTSGQEIPGYRLMRRVSREVASLLGQMLALVALTVLCFLAGQRLPHTAEEIAASFQPVMVVPALITAFIALLCVLRFPLSNRYMQKVLRFLHIRESGEENKALEQQLEEVVIKRHVQPLGIRFLMAVMRPFFRHTVKGAENIHPDDSNPLVFLCNHGEIYGPVVANLYVPITFRPWVISNMMEKEAIVEHIYQGTMVRQRWLPERWKRPLINLISPLLVWVFNSLEAIPVYRGQPKELMRTFRETLNAMQAGDNILVFPENAENHAPGEGGYAREGVGQLYTGFAMIDP